MPKLVTVKQTVGQAEKAADYVKAYILFPAGILGLICMVGGTGALGYQLVTTDSYTWTTFFQSSGLLVLGGLFGWAQTKYQQWILREHPEVYAYRMRPASSGRESRSKRRAAPSTASSAGPVWVPLAYVAAAGVVVAASVFCAEYGSVHAVGSYLMPWAGFFWAKLFFWRSVIKVGR